MPGGEFNIQDLEGVVDLGAVNVSDSGAPAQFKNASFTSADQQFEVKTPQTTLDNFLGLG